MTQTPKSQTEVILADQAEALPGQWTGADINLMHELWPKLDLTDFRTLLRVCIARGLNPLSDDVYPVVYNANKPRPIRKLVLIESIDSMRRRGHATEVVVEMKGPQFCSKEEPEKWVDVWTSEEMPFAARYWMKARHMDEGSWRVRLWSEVAKSGTGDEFWRSHAQGGQPVHMLGNAVERLQWRMTCPAIFSNMYGPEEMGVTNILSVPTSELSTWEPEALGPVVADEDGVIEDGAAPQPNSGDEETPAPTDIPAESTPEPAPESESASQKWVADHPATTLPATAAIIGTLEVALKTRGLTHEQIGAVTGATDNDGVADWVRNQMGDAGTLNEAIADLCNMAASADSE